MSHEISEVSGRAEIAYAGATPWHGLGENVGECQTAQEMVARAGLAWEVELRALFRGDGAVPVEGWKGIVRTDADVLLGVVSAKYRPIQNRQAADMVDALVAEGGAHVEVAGALGQGERCWMLCHIPADFEVVAGDLIRPYFLLAWGHDGKHGLAGKLTPIRVVCHNTLTAAGFGRGVKWSESAQVYVRHYGQPTLRIEEARKALGLMRRQVEALQPVYQRLAAAPLRDPQGYFGAVFPTPAVPEPLAPKTPEADDYLDRLERWQARQSALLTLYEGGATVPAARGTVWAGYNAVTEWADHVYPVLKNGRVSARRQESVLFGHYAGVKRQALDAALALASS